jgi:hypothetical protein
VSQRSGPAAGRRRGRRVRAIPAAVADPGGNRAARRACTVTVTETVVDWCPAHDGAETDAACWCAQNDTTT